MITIRADTEQKRLDKSAETAEKRGRGCRMTPVHTLIRPNLRRCTTAAAFRSRERLTHKSCLAILTANGMPLGGCLVLLSKQVAS